jgi:hypothetical protein
LPLVFVDHRRDWLSVGAGAGNLFFQLVNARYESGAMILTSNRGFAEWGKVFGDPVVATALLDRAAAPRRGRPHRGRQLPAARDGSRPGAGCGCPGPCVDFR